MKNNVIIPMFPRHRSNRGLYYFLIAVLLTALITSCSMSKKIKTSEHTELDTTSVKKSDSTGVAKKDSTGTTTSETAAIKSTDSASTKTTKETKTEKITVNLKPEVPATGNDSGNIKGKGRPKNDYAGAEEVYDVKVNGHMIHSNRPIDNIVIENSQGKETIDASKFRMVDSSGAKNSQVSHVNQFDSGHKSNSDSLQVHQETDKKGKWVSRLGSNPLIWLGGLVIVILAIYFGFIRKRKKDPADKNSNTLTSIKYEPPPPAQNEHNS